jgi:hypothetical protein
LGERFKEKKQCAQVVSATRAQEEFTYLGQRDDNEAASNDFSLLLTIFACNPRFSIEEKPMNNLKLGLYVAVLVSLICVFTPCGAQAQDDGPVPWPCNHVVVGNGLTNRWPCMAPTQEDGLIPSVYYSLAQDGASNPLPFGAPVQDDVFVPRLCNTITGITASTSDEALNQYALFEDRRLEFALIRS